MNKSMAMLVLGSTALAVSACATQPEEYASLCFNSQDEAASFGQYIWNQNFVTRTGEMLYGEPRRVPGLGVAYRGFDSSDECPAGQHAMRITYEPTQDAEYPVAEVLASARVVAVQMRGEYESYMSQQ